MTDNLARFEARVRHEPASGCWLWTGALYWDGYGAFRMNGKQIRAHHASWRLFRGDIPGGLFVLHRCDVPACVNPSHLFVGTHQQNMDDAVTKQRMAVGSRVKGARLSDEAVIAMRDVCRAKLVTNEELAAEYGVCVETVRQAITGRTWKHLPGAMPVAERSKRTRARGSRNGSAKLTAAQVGEIKAGLAEGRESIRALAARYGVGIGAMSRIGRGQTWATA